MSNNDPYCRIQERGSLRQAQDEREGCSPPLLQRRGSGGGVLAEGVEQPAPQRASLPPPPTPSSEEEGAFASSPIFTPARKLRFLDELARHGNVRVAAARCGVSRSGAYLARHRDAAFSDAWRAALVLGRDRAVEEMAERAIEGWQEPVFYRGRQVAVRRRYDARLLLAHLARLDKACAEGSGGEAGAEALAARYDALRGALVGIPDDEVAIFPLDPVHSVQSAPLVAPPPPG